MKLTIELTNEEADALRAMLIVGLSPLALWPENTALIKLLKELKK